MKNKLFTKTEKEAIETVLDMGIYLTNCYGAKLTTGGGFDTYYEIEDRLGTVRDYKTISSALTQFFKELND